MRLARVPSHAISLALYLLRLPTRPSVDVKAPLMTSNEASIWRIGAEARMNWPLMANFRSFVSLPVLGNAILRKIDKRSLQDKRIERVIRARVYVCAENIYILSNELPLDESHHIFILAK